MTDAIATTHDTYAQILEQDLLRRYGPLIGHEELRQALGYPSMDAFRQAAVRKQLPVPVFVLPKRHGKYALVKDVAAWLAQCRATAVVPGSPVDPAGGEATAQ